MRKTLAFSKGLPRIELEIEAIVFNQGNDLTDQGY